MVSTMADPIPPPSSDQKFLRLAVFGIVAIMLVGGIYLTGKGLAVPPWLVVPLGLVSTYLAWLVRSGGQPPPQA